MQRKRSLLPGIPPTVRSAQFAAGLLLGLGILLPGPVTFAAPSERSEIMILTSSAFSHNGAIPKRHTCDGEDIAPPLSWSALPAGTKSLVLIVDDPDAPDPAAPTMTWVHWVLYNIPPSANGLAEGGKTLPAGTLSGENDWHRMGYGGPCPPIGRHRYVHKLYALDIVLGGISKASKSALEKAMQGHIIGRAELVGTYQRQRP
jgi:Raf kinase inhibitor-like YbhB/YbcL family protein